MVALLSRLFSVSESGETHVAYHKDLAL